MSLLRNFLQVSYSRGIARPFEYVDPLNFNSFLPFRISFSATNFFEHFFAHLYLS